MDLKPWLSHMMVLLSVSNWAVLKVVQVPPAAYRPPDITNIYQPTKFYSRPHEEMEILCTSSGVPGPRFQWLENDLDIRNNADMRYDPFNGTLTVPRFVEKPNTYYRCIATNDFSLPGLGSVSLSIMSPAVQLLEFKLEKFNEESDHVSNLTEHDYLVLPCGDTKASSAPELTYVWYDERRRAIGLGGGRLFIDIDGSLHFTYLLNGDQNVKAYVCGISTHLGYGLPIINLGTTHIIHVRPRIPPTPPEGIKPVFRYSNTVVMGIQNTSATLQCVFSGYGVGLIPRQSWTDSLGRPYINSSKYNISGDGREFTISNIQENDEMFYHCHANNSAGSASSSVFLNVTSPPIFVHGQPRHKVGIEGGDVQVNCETRAVKDEKPPGRPTWFINSKRYSATKFDASKFEVSSSGSIMTVKHLNMIQDVMCIQCEVRNDIGVVLGTSCLEITSQMIITRQPPLYQEIAYGQSIDLTVEATVPGSVMLKYRWSFPNGTFDEDNIPSYMTFDHTSKRAFINTSKVPVDQFKFLAGTYNITVFHPADSRSVITEVKLITAEMEVTTGGFMTPFGTSGDSWLIPLLAVIAITALVLLLLLCLFLRKSKPGSGEEAEDIIVEIDLPPPTEYNDEMEEEVESVEYSVDYGSEV